MKFQCKSGVVSLKVESSGALGVFSRQPAQLASVFGATEPLLPIPMN